MQTVTYTAEEVSNELVGVSKYLVSINRSWTYDDQLLSSALVLVQGLKRNLLPLFIFDHQLPGFFDHFGAR